MPRELKGYDELSSRYARSLHGATVTINGTMIENGKERERSITMVMDAREYRTYQYWMSRGKEATARTYALSEVYNGGAGVPALAGVHEYVDPNSDDWPYDDMADYDDDDFPWDYEEGEYRVHD